MFRWLLVSLSLMLSVCVSRAGADGYVSVSDRGAVREDLRLCSSPASPFLPPLSPSLSIQSIRSGSVDLSSRVVVFLHAGFPSRETGSSELSLSVLYELLETLSHSGAIDVADLYATFTGSTTEVCVSHRLFRKFTGGRGRVIEPLHGAEGEFATLSFMQHFADAAPKDTLYLYLHTKGITHDTQSTSDWRRYMTYFLVERFQVCLLALTVYGYSTCGVGKQKDGMGVWHYSGNFWWATGEWIRSTEKLSNKIWDRNHAELFLLQGVSDEESGKHHYCMHHPHHDQYLCETPRDMYTNFDLRVRSTGNCIVPQFILTRGVCYESYSFNKYSEDMKLV